MSDHTGAIIWKAQYKAWGECKVEKVKSNFFENSEIISNNIRFQGQYFDQETGLHYNRYRYYSYNVGRYISKDPVGLFGGLNTYQYAPNSNFWVDPLGLKGVSVKPAPVNSPFDYYLTLDSKVYPETAGHIKSAIARGHASIVTVDPINAPARRRLAMKGHPCKTGYDRDEWPMAMFKEGGLGASVKYIKPSDNKGAGKSIQLGLAGAGVLPGDKVKIFVK